MSISLVSMPFKDLRTPPIQLGLLGACLKRAGLEARSCSLELAFMEHLQRSSEGDEQRLTVADYATIIEHHAVSLGDWIFKVSIQWPVE